MFITAAYKIQVFGFYTKIGPSTLAQAFILFLFSLLFFVFPSYVYVLSCMGAEIRVYRRNEDNSLVLQQVSRYNKSTCTCRQLFSTSVFCLILLALNIGRRDIFYHNIFSDMTCVFELFVVTKERKILCLISCR